jgi:hypothetical protein
LFLPTSANRATFKIKPEGNTLLGRPKHNCEDNIKTDLRERELEDVDWIHLA